MQSRHLLQWEHENPFDRFTSREGEITIEMNLKIKVEKDEKQSAIKINIGNFMMLSCVVHFSLLLFQSCGLHDLHRLLYLAQLRKKRKQKKSNFSRDGCFGMFMMIINIITVRRKKCLFELLSWACVQQQQQRFIIIPRLETDIYDVCTLHHRLPSLERTLANA